MNLFKEQFYEHDMERFKTEHKAYNDTMITQYNNIISLYNIDMSNQSDIVKNMEVNSNPNVNIYFYTNADNGNIIFSNLRKLEQYIKNNTKECDIFNSPGVFNMSIYTYMCTIKLNHLKNNLHILEYIRTSFDSSIIGAIIDEIEICIPIPDGQPNAGHYSIYQRNPWIYNNK